MNIRLPTLLKPLWPVLKPMYTFATRVVSIFTALLSRIVGGQLPRRSAMTVDDVVARGEGRMVVVRPPQTFAHELPAGWPESFATFRRKNDLRRFEATSGAQAEDVVMRVAVAELPRGRVMGPHRAVITAEGTLIQELSRYWGVTRASEHPLYLHPFTDPPVDLEGRIGVLAGRGDEIYYHFLIDIMPRLALLRSCDAFAPVDRWYAPASRGWQRELLAMVGLPSELLVDSDETPHVRADLVIPTFPDDAGGQASPWVVEYLREQLLPEGIEPVHGRRIYISRGRQRGTRIVLNEPEVLDVLEEEGFSVVDPESFGMQEEIRTYAEAEWIVSAHGSALANLVFASPGASVVELFAPGYIRGCYWKLASRVGVEYRYVIGQGQFPRRGSMTRVPADITVDVEALRATLRSLPVVAAKRP